MENTNTTNTNVNNTAKPYQMDAKAPVKVITHSSIRHSDELLAMMLIQDSTCVGVDVTFTRDEDTIQNGLKNPNVYVVDVGKKFDRDMRNFDHHQGDPKLSELSAAGLVYDVETTFEPEPFLDGLVRRVNLQDNGRTKEAWEPTDQTFQLFESLMSLVEYINPGVGELLNEEEIAYKTRRVLWHQANHRGSTGKGIVDFLKVGFHPTALLFEEVRKKNQDNSEKIKGISEKVLEEMEGQKEILYLEEFLPVFSPDVTKNIWSELSKFYLVVYPTGKEWRVQTVPEALGSPKPKIPFDPKRVEEIWGEDPDFVFTHKAGFIVGTKSYPFAVRIAKDQVAHSKVTKKIPFVT